MDLYSSVTDDSIELEFLGTMRNGESDPVAVSIQVEGTETELGREQHGSASCARQGDPTQTA